VKNIILVGKLVFSGGLLGFPPKLAIKVTHKVPRNVTIAF
jgi:hypothetical protein